MVWGLFWSLIKTCLIVKHVSWTATYMIMHYFFTSSFLLLSNLIKTYYAVYLLWQLISRVADGDSEDENEKDAIDHNRNGAKVEDNVIWVRFSRVCVCVYMYHHVTAGFYVDDFLFKILHTFFFLSLSNFYLFDFFFHKHIFRWMTWTTSTQYILKKPFEIIENKRVILQYIK